MNAVMKLSLLAGTAALVAAMWPADPAQPDLDAPPESPSARHSAAEVISASPFGIAAHDRLMPVPQAPVSQASPLPVAPVPVAPDRASDLHSLSRSPDAGDAFAAYALIDACMRARDAESAVEALPMDAQGLAMRRAVAGSPANAAALCGGITPGDIAGRLALLERAASAQVPGAAVALAEEGPFGDRSALEQRPDDLLVVEWKRQVVELMQAAARHGDKGAMLALSNAHREGGIAVLEPQQALAYRVAHAAMTRAEGDRPSRAESRIAASLAEELSPAQAAQAMDQGLRLAAACCKKEPS